MPRKDTSVAIKQDIYIMIPNDGEDATWAENFRMVDIRIKA